MRGQEVTWDFYEYTGFRNTTSLYAWRGSREKSGDRVPTAYRIRYRRPDYPFFRLISYEIADMAGGVQGFGREAAFHGPHGLSKGVCVCVCVCVCVRERESVSVCV